MRNYIFLVCLLLVTGYVNSMQDPSASLPVNINGEWEGVFIGEFGGIANTKFEFVKHGDTLTGYVTFSGNPIPIEKGKIENNEISFNIKYRTADRNDITSYYKGTVTGDKIKMHCRDVYKGDPLRIGTPSDATVERVF